MGYIFWRKAEDGSTEAAGPYRQGAWAEKTEAMIRIQLGLGEGDAAFFPRRQSLENFEAVAGRACNEIGRELGLTDENQFKFAWIVDFPMYEKGVTKADRLFAQPVFHAAGRAWRRCRATPLSVKGYQYDLACVTAMN